MSYHCCFRDGSKAVDEDVAGDIDRWTWQKQTNIMDLFELDVY